MKHLSLFSGIGGFDLAAEWLGWENVMQVEIDSFCQNVLRKIFPNVKKELDIKGFQGYEYEKTIDVISGGFPCQPFSHAGKRKGSGDDRHLWPEMFRVIRQIKPSWCVIENVRGIIDIEGGLVFEQVRSDLENIGFETQPFIIPACAVNAPHRRDRVWIIAYSDSNRRQRIVDKKIQGKSRKSRYAKRGVTKWSGRWTIPEPRTVGVDDGIRNRTHRIKALGNAIVPQVAYQIFKTIDQYELLLSKAEIRK